jgi:minor extracellular serine protease Vpr
MRKRFPLLFLALVTIIGFALPAAAGDGLDHTPDHLAIDREWISLDQAAITDLDQVVPLFLHLTEASVAEFVAAERSQGRADPSPQARRSQAQRVEQQHARVMRHLDRMGYQPESALKAAVNGLRVWAPLTALPDLQAIPEVEVVAPVTLHQPANDTSVPWINTPQAQEFIDGTGEGVIIAVIDTGVDYTHASMGGSGDPADYDAIDREIIQEVDGEPVFPTTKVIGGWDFAGTDYDASGDLGSTEPSPDPNPIDVHGHGTHVAATAAGLEVLDDEDDVLVGAGVAPGAQVYALKVFGDVAGSTALTADAIEWAVDPTGDGSMVGQADVINMSLGASFGHPLDPSAVASQNAVEAGTVVVASAGNSGQNAAYVTGAPAVAPGAISVAASIDGGYSVLGLEVHSPEDVAGTYEAAESAIGVPLVDAGPLTGDLVVADPLLACDDLANAQEMDGKIALVQRGTCPFSDKHLNAQAAGAVGIVVFNNVAGDPIVMGGDSTGIAIPGVMVSLADGQLLQGTVEEGETVSVTMSADVTIPRPDLADTLAGFTSRGPGGTVTFKPDVAAPGFGIRSAAVGTGTRAAASSGTSMAAPHVAGLAALLAQQHDLPALEGDDRVDTATAIRGLIVGSSIPAGAGVVDYPLTLQGVGVVRADRAVMAEAFTTPTGVSFGRLNPLTATTVTETVGVTNLADEERTFGISFDAMQQVPGVTVSHDLQVTVDATSTATFEVTLTLDPAAMPSDSAWFSQTEVDGWLVLDDGNASTPDVRTGVLAVVDPASDVAVSFARGVRGAGNALAISNPGPGDGYAYGFSLAGSGDDIGGVTEAIGVRTDVFTIPGVGSFDVVQFGLATDAWDSLSSRETQILLDVDSGSGGFDYALVGADLGLLLGASPTGTVATALFDLQAGGGFLQWMADGDYHNQVQALAMDRHPPFGLSRGQESFDYLALTFDRSELVGLQSGSVDLKNVDKQDNPLLAVPSGVDATRSIDRQDRREMLWLYPNNPVSSQFDIVRLR